MFLLVINALLVIDPSKINALMTDPSPVTAEARVGLRCRPGAPIGQEKKLEARADMTMWCLPGGP